MSADKENIEEQLKTVMDPETGVSIVDMGFIYGIETEGNSVSIEMTLTTPGCPMHSSFKREVEEKIGSMDGVKEVEVKIVFDPPWTPEKMSDKAKEKLGYDKN